MERKGKNLQKNEKKFKFFIKKNKKFIDKYFIICYTYNWIFSGALLQFDKNPCA
jgi:hypothetical protein